MNLFARILSHGFALAVVVMIAVGLIYRGELFPGGELPEFLQFGSSQQDDNTISGGIVSRQPEDSDSDKASDPDVEAVRGGDTDSAVTDTTAALAADSAQQLASEQETSLADNVDSDDALDMAKDMTEAAASSESPAAVESSMTERVPSDEQFAVSDNVAASVDAPANSGMTQAPVAPETPETSGTSGTSGTSIVPEAPESLTGADVETDAAAKANVVEEKGQLDSESEQVSESQLPGSAAASAERMSDEAASVDSDTGMQPTEQGNTAAASADDDAEVTNNQTTPDDVEGQTAYRLLASARESYWLRDYAAAEKHYQALISLEPGNPDGYGELGNMYFSQGKWSEASAAYFEAGKRLADEGIHEQALQLVDVIRGLQGSQGDELAAYIKSSQAASN